MNLLKAAIFLLIIILFSAVGIFVISKSNINYRFSTSYQDVEFVSNKVKPLDYLHNIKQKRYYFILAAEFEENNAALNQKITQAITLYNTVLFANKRELITLLKVLNDNNLQYCQTNYGDTKTNVQISADKCKKILSQLDNNMLIELKKPQNLNKSRIVVDPPIITIIPNSIEKIQHANYLLLKAMFPNADAAIAAVNKGLEKVNG